MGAINLAIKYSDKIAAKFTRDSFVAGNVSNDYEFTGVKTIRVYTPQTVPLVNYTRSGTQRFGTPTEMEDVVQELTLAQDKSFSLTIDAGNNSDQQLTKNAGKMLNLQINEQVVPIVDKNYFAKLYLMAGKVANVAAPSKTTICGLIDDAIQALDDALVPDNGRVLYLSSASYKLLRQSGEILGVDLIAKDALTRGTVGMYGNAKVVKVPSSYFPTGVQFVLVYKNATIMPQKMQKARILTDVQGLDGASLEGRNYFDAFVLGAKCDGVYVATTATKQATPTGAAGAGTITLTSATASSIKYTIDGSDPRYSLTALIASTAVANTADAGTYTVKAVAYGAATAVSDVYSASLTVT